MPRCFVYSVNEEIFCRGVSGGQICCRIELQPRLCTFGLQKQPSDKSHSMFWKVNTFPFLSLCVHISFVPSCQIRPTSSWNPISCQSYSAWNATRFTLGSSRKSMGTSRLTYLCIMGKRRPESINDSMPLPKHQRRKRPSRYTLACLLVRDRPIHLSTLWISEIPLCHYRHLSRFILPINEISLPSISARSTESTSIIGKDREICFAIVCPALWREEMPTWTWTITFFNDEQLL